MITLCPQWENWDRAGPRAWFSFFFFTQFWTPAQRIVLPPFMVALLALVKLFGNAPEDAPSQVSFHGDSKSSQTANSCHPKTDVKLWPIVWALALSCLYVCVGSSAWSLLPIEKGWAQCLVLGSRLAENATCFCLS